MNFKPTLWKSIASIIIGIAGWVYGEWGIKCDSFGGCGYFHVSSILLELTGLAIVYIVWSSIQKDETDSLLTLRK